MTAANRSYFDKSSRETKTAFSRHLLMTYITAVLMIYINLCFSIICFTLGRFMHSEHP